jgi:hypothetical protein
VPYCTVARTLVQAAALGSGPAPPGRASDKPAAGALKKAPRGATLAGRVHGGDKGVSSGLGKSDSLRADSTFDEEAGSGAQRQMKVAQSAPPTNSPTTSVLSSSRSVNPWARSVSTMEAAYQPNPQRKRAAQPPPLELLLFPTGRGTGEAIQTVAAPPFAELYRVDRFLTKQPGR